MLAALASCATRLGGAPEGGSARYRQRPAAGGVRPVWWVTTLGGTSQWYVVVRAWWPAAQRRGARSDRQVGGERHVASNVSTASISGRIRKRRKATGGPHHDDRTPRPAQAVGERLRTADEREPSSVRDERNWARNGVLADWDRSAWPFALRSREENGPVHEFAMYGCAGRV